ncbi:MAG: 2-dehydro-3-deoxy-D-gluconate 5-dehydrogenase KduD [Bacteroidota bacterium]
MGVLNTFDLIGKVALLTGGARGLGQAMAIGLAEAGADVCVLDRDDVTETCKRIEQTGRKAVGIREDLSGLSPESAQSILAACAAALGELDILINNAGIIRRAPAIAFPEEDWRQVLDIHLNATFFLSQAAANVFVHHHKPGKIINIASMLSFQGGLTVPSYTAAKSAILGLTKALANEWAAKGINVNAIAPGYFTTEVTAGIRSDPVRNQAILNRIPAGEWGDPNALKGTIVYLASAASDYVHGTVVPVDGGWLAN